MFGAWLEAYSAGEVSLIIGLITGLLFGACAQQSQFCLRSACIEFWRGQSGSKFAIWLFTFATALFCTQWLVSIEWLPRADIRQLATTGSLSGAIIGGSMFGIGMILARGCASRLLVLSATGNLRALLTGLVVTVISQASLRGALSPSRMEISSWWLVAPFDRDLTNHLPAHGALIFAVILFGVAIWFAQRSDTSVKRYIFAILVGLSVAMGWGITAWHAGWSFELVPIKSVSFTGPSADTLMGLINSPMIPLEFDIGIVLGVFVGSFCAAQATGQFSIATFTHETGLSRYLIGACLMGYGGMMAGGCAVGAGITGGAVMAVTAWVALLFMWLAAGITDYFVDRPKPTRS